MGNDGLAQKLFVERGYGDTQLEVDHTVSLGDILAHQSLGGTEEEEVAKVFMAYLCDCSRQGHLCVHWDGERLNPESEDEKVEEGVKRILEREDLWEKLALRVFRSGAEHYIYFEKYWHYETRVLEHYQRLRSSLPDRVVEDVVMEEALLPEQAEAVREVCRRCLTLISGGPGTGKSYLVKHLIRVLSEVLGPLRVAVAAPTGKAASRLEGVEGFCGTLHRLLEINVSGERRRGAPRYLEADLIIVDESSMVDVHMMGHLLSAVKPGARLVLMGDADQLPSVEAGSIFRDLVGLGGSVKLSRCMRVEEPFLVELAAAVREKEMGLVIDRLKEAGCWRTIGDRVEEELVQRALGGDASFRILCPLRQGRLGVDRINALCSSLDRGNVKPIMITRTDDLVGLVNGETGFLVDGEYAVFGEEKRVPIGLLPPYEYAYGLSVHKSQGSEYDRVLLLLPEGSEVFGWQVFYTAITRARKALEVWSSEETLERVLSQSFVRCSGLRERFLLREKEVFR